MVYKFFIFLLILTMHTGFPFGNMTKGFDDYLKHHEAESLKQSIDRAIVSEVKKEPPNGHRTKSYSRELWNEYWNNRIFHVYEFEKKPSMKAYEGPSGEEFIRYIIEERRRRGLPELAIEERNKDRVPEDLFEE